MLGRFGDAWLWQGRWGSLVRRACAILAFLVATFSLLGCARMPERNATSPDAPTPVASLQSNSISRPSIELSKVELRVCLYDVWSERFLLEVLIAIDVNTQDASYTFAREPRRTFRLTSEQVETMRLAWTRAQNSGSAGPWPSDSSPATFDVAINGQEYGEYPEDALRTEAEMEVFLATVYRALPSEASSAMSQKLQNITGQDILTTSAEALRVRLSTWSKGTQ